MGELKELTLASFRGNTLSSLPDSMGQLTKLSDLDCSSNRLTSVPDSFGRLSSLRQLDLHDNPLVDPYPNLVQRGTQAVIEYLKTLLESVPQYEARVLIVGEGNVGKSCLAAALREEPFVANRETTHGIVLGTLDLRHPAGNQVLHLNTWDFGGQGDYLITHQFFYSKRSIYLLVWHPRHSAQDGVEPWLERLRLRLGDDARVIVVATHAAERPAGLNLADLRRRFGGIVLGFCRVECSIADVTTNGIHELRTKLAEASASLPQMGQKLSKQWAAVRDRLQQLCSKQIMHIQREKYEKFCKAESVSNEASQTLIDLLHDLGKVIHFSDDSGLRQLIVLNPEWLSKAIALVLADNEVMQKGGLLEHERFAKIWHDHGRPNEPQYPASYYPFFLRLMEKFDISYRIPDTDASLIGQRVPLDRPDFDIKPARSSRSLMLVYQMEEDPPGLIPWLIVRNHRFSVGRHWRYGMHLTHQQSNAIIEYNHRYRRLELQVSAPTPDYFFHLMIDGISQVLMHWPGLRYQQLVPCPTSKGATCSGSFPLASLKTARESSISQFRCYTCLEEHDVTKLLTGFAQEKSPLVSQISEILDDKLLNLSENLEQLISSVRHTLRRTLKAISNDYDECPRLFTLWPKDRTLMGIINPLNLGQSVFELWLWCDHPGHEHPVKRYELRIPMEWLKLISPYASLVAKTIRLLLPVVGAIDEARKGEVEIMEQVADQFIVSTETPDQAKGLTEAQGAGLRALRTLLKKHDPSSEWGRLRRVLTNEGDFQWVCPVHYSEYDPGLLGQSKEDLGATRVRGRRKKHPQ
ncbi:hypothetical protein J0H58_21700 [bacterium]|nr:hypothetical protein [bacterium]